MKSNDYQSLSALNDQQPLTREQIHALARQVFVSRPMPSFEGLEKSQTLAVTAVFQGTARIFDPRRGVSQLGLKAAFARHRVFCVNGIGTYTTQSAVDNFQDHTQGLGKLLPSHLNDASCLNRKWSQALSGQSMLENALKLVKEIRGLGVIPAQINAAGYSRGGVSATLLVTLLDCLFEDAGIADQDKPRIRLALFDPVASLHACSAQLVSRSALCTNPNIDDAGVLVFVSLDPYRRFTPQAGTAGAKEYCLTLPSNHQGLEGGDFQKKHHRAASLVTRLLSFKHFNLITTQDDDVRLLRAVLTLSAEQQDIALRVRWHSSWQQKRKDLRYHLGRLVYQDMYFRREGQILLGQIESSKNTLDHLFINAYIGDIFKTHFSIFNDILEAYFNAKHIEIKRECIQAFELQVAKTPMPKSHERLLAKTGYRIKAHFNKFYVESMREAKLTQLADKLSQLSNSQLSK